MNQFKPNARKIQADITDAMMQIEMGRGSFQFKMALADMLRNAAAEYLAYADEIDPRVKPEQQNDLFDEK